MKQPASSSGAPSIEIRSVVLEPAECAVLSPELEDYLRTQIAHRLGFRAAPVCRCEIDSGRLTRCGN